jgi:zinc/manganese transport system substrate-binding protein
VRLLSVAVAVGCALGAAGCSASNTTRAAGSPIAVLAGENFWGSIAAQIGGSRVAVTSIISDPNTDPHEYESDPRDAAAVARADLVIENGLGYDDFLGKQISANGGGKTVLNIQKLVGVTGDDANPHLWYSPTYVTKAAEAMEQEFARQAPEYKAAFESNLKTFLKAYQPYIDTIGDIKKTYGGEAISYTERVPGYLIAAAGLHLGTPKSFSQAVEEDTDPTPQDTTQFNKDIQEHKVKVLLYNGQVTDDQTTQIKKTATESGVPIVGVTETIPTAGEDFQTWQIDQAKALLAALGG